MIRNSQTKCNHKNRKSIDDENFETGQFGSVHSVFFYNNKWKNDGEPHFDDYLLLCFINHSVRGAKMLVNNKIKVRRVMSVCSQCIHNGIILSVNRYQCGRIVSDVDNGFRGLF